MMRSPRLDRQVTIERKVSAQDSTYGNAVVTWEPLAYEPGSPAVAEKFWAEVVDVQPGRAESKDGGLAVSRNATRMRMRWRSDIDSSMRVLLHGDGDPVVYQIIGGPAEVGGRKTMIEIIAERISS